MPDFDAITEQRIRDALARGEFDNLPGQGQPLELDDDSLIPEDQRLAYRILKNAGYVPEEVENRREIASLQQELPQLNGEGRAEALRRLHFLMSKVGAVRGRSLQVEAAYYERLVEKLAGEPDQHN
jgi:uncharacterized protein YydD (DUF2326 family)